MTTRAELEATLGTCDPEALALVLHASGVGTSGMPWASNEPRTAADLAHRIVAAIWWNYATPLGYLASRATFEDIVRHLSTKLGVADRIDPRLPVLEQVSRLTEVLLGSLDPEAVTFDRIDAATRRRLGPSYGPSAGLGSGAVGSFASRWGAGRVLALLRTPLGRLLPFVPAIGPWVRAIAKGAGAVFVVSGPLGVGLAVASANTALGANYRRLVPLVLGVGALGVTRIDEARTVS